MKLIFLLLVLAESAWSACNNLDMTITTASHSFNSNATPALNIHLDKSGGSGCDWFITFGYGGASSYSTRRIVNGIYTIPVQIYANSGHTQVLKHFPDISASTDVISGSFTAGNKNTDVKYYPTMGAVTYDRFGDYSDTFVVRLYDGVYNGTNSLRDTENAELTYNMARKIDLSLVETNGAFNVSDTHQPMSFGSLSPGLQQAMDIVLKYNAGYNLKFSSAQNGNLKHATLTDTVPYTMTVAGNPVSLGGSSTTPVTVASGTGVSPTNGQRLAVVATVGSIGTARAGTYNDTITVTVTTTE